MIRLSPSEGGRHKGRSYPVSVIPVAPSSGKIIALPSHYSLAGYANSVYLKNILGKIKPDYDKVRRNGTTECGGLKPIMFR